MNGTRGRRNSWHTSERQRSQGGMKGQRKVKRTGENNEMGKDTIRNKTGNCK